MAGRKGTSFPVLLTGNVMHYVELLLFQLKQQPLMKTQITLKKPYGSNETVNSQGYIKLLEDYLHFIEHEKIGPVYRYALADNGLKFLEYYDALNRKDEAFRIMHNAAYQGIIHYKLFFDILKEKEKIRIEGNRVKKLRNTCNRISLEEYGIEIFDDNDINSTYYLAKAIGSIEEVEDDEHFIVITDKYKLDFDWDSFIEAIREIMSPKKPYRMFTKDLCESLFERKEWFVRGETQIGDILEIFEKLRALLKANRGILEFKPAYPKPPISYTHTLIELHTLELKSPGGDEDV